jgi:hypothetical protein
MAWIKLTRTQLQIFIWFCPYKKNLGMAKIFGWHEMQPHWPLATDRMTQHNNKETWC